MICVWILSSPEIGVKYCIKRIYFILHYKYLVSINHVTEYINWAQNVNGITRWKSTVWFSIPEYKTAWINSRNSLYHGKFLKKLLFGDLSQVLGLSPWWPKYHGSSSTDKEVIWCRFGPDDEVSKGDFICFSKLGDSSLTVGTSEVWPSGLSMKILSGENELRLAESLRLHSYFDNNPELRDL